MATAKDLILKRSAFLVSTTMVVIASTGMFLWILCLLPGIGFFSSKTVIEVIT